MPMFWKHQGAVSLRQMRKKPLKIDAEVKMVFEAAIQRRISPRSTLKLQKSIRIRCIYKTKNWTEFCCWVNMAIGIVGFARSKFHVEALEDFRLLWTGQNLFIYQSIWFRKRNRAFKRILPFSKSEKINVKCFIWNKVDTTRNVLQTFILPRLSGVLNVDLL